MSVPYSVTLVFKLQGKRERDMVFGSCCSSLMLRSALMRIPALKPRPDWLLSWWWLSLSESVPSGCVSAEGSITIASLLLHSTSLMQLWIFIPVQNLAALIYQMENRHLFPVLQQKSHFLILFCLVNCFAVKISIKKCIYMKREKF